MASVRNRSSMGNRPAAVQKRPFGTGLGSAAVAYTEPFTFTDVVTVDAAFATVSAEELLRASVIRSVYSGGDHTLQLPAPADLVAALGPRAAAGLSLRVHVLHAADTAAVNALTVTMGGVGLMGMTGGRRTVYNGRAATFLLVVTSVAAGLEAAELFVLSRDNSRQLGARDGQGMTLVFPLYQYPTWTGEHYYVQAGEVQKLMGPRMIMIINPNNGLDAASPPNGDWTTGLGLFNSAAGPWSGRCLGYVATNYGDVDIASVKALVDGYVAHWSAFVSGLFVDECSNLEMDLTYYDELVGYARAAGLTQVMLNPGTNVSEGYATIPGVTHVITQEDLAANWPAYAPSEHQLVSETPEKYVALVRNLADDRDLDEIIAEARRRNFGGFFATERGEYNEAPTYFRQLVNRLL
jgi:hypothetical protein